ncbi:MAG: MurR/RpiR family transcriptional regulator, partial [Clostridiales bacterium]|nr:MurR/RpiR family transcriptional regulator [Clostridiales bacterium]
MKTMFLLAESLDRLSPTERRVAEHILSLGDHLLKTTISEIADACGTGKSVVVQTCKKAGYKGFKDLCSAFSVSKAMSSKRPIPTGYYIDLYPGLAHEDICRLVISSIL